MEENPDTLAAGFRRIKAEDGMSRARLLRAYAAYRPRDGHKMLLSEFMALDLHRHDKVPEGYVGTREAAEFARRINFQPHKRGLVADKLLFDAALRGLGFAVPPIQAIFGAKHLPPPVRSLGHKQAIGRFLREEARYPLFGKPLSGQNSTDILSLDGYDAQSDRLRLVTGQSVALSEALDMIAPKHYRWGYLFQTRIRQHPALEAAIGRTVGCVRIVTFLAGAEARVIGAVWKIPRAHMPADNLWRGGLLAEIDPDSGRIGRLRDGLGPAAGWLERHPDTGAPLTGITLPHWPRLTRRVTQAAGLLSGLPLVGWDVALGPEGPVFIEANTSPSLDLLQYPARRPVLVPELRQAMLAEAHRLRGLANADRAERKRRLKTRIRTRLTGALGFGRDRGE